MNRVSYNQQDKPEDEYLSWAKEFLERLGSQIALVKVDLMVHKWIKEEVYVKLPTKTQERIWAVAWLLSEIKSHCK